MAGSLSIQVRREAQIQKIVAYFVGGPMNGRKIRAKDRDRIHIDPGTHERVTYRRHVAIALRGIEPKTVIYALDSLSPEEANELAREAIQKPPPMSPPE